MAGQSRPFTGDVAVRHDIFNRFKDATTLRASMLAKLGGGFAARRLLWRGHRAADLLRPVRILPRSFVGNPSLKPESSRGLEASLRYPARHRSRASLTGYRQRLHDEIVDCSTADLLTSTINRDGTSHRSGIEAELGWNLGEQLRLTANYAYLHATELETSAVIQIRETRRPKHSGSVALDGAAGRFSYGASIAYAGNHIDSNFDVFPFADRPSRRLLARQRARRLSRCAPELELFARAANAFDSRYQDVLGYRTEGRSLYAGIRLAVGR